MELVEYAKSELERLGKDEDGIQEVMNRQIMEIVETFGRQGHSGFTANYALNILERLLRYKPITPLTGDDGEWEKKDHIAKDGAIIYQNRRYGGVFKCVYPDGTVKYTDCDRVICKQFGDDSAPCWTNSFITKKIVDELCPITMPYRPPDRAFKVYVCEHLCDPKNGDFDTMGVMHLTTPEGAKMNVNRYFKENRENEGGWEEIDLVEYLERIENGER